MLEIIITEGEWLFGTAWSSGRKTTVLKYTAVTSVLYVLFQSSADSLPEVLLHLYGVRCIGESFGARRAGCGDDEREYFSFAST